VNNTTSLSETSIVSKDRQLMAKSFKLKASSAAVNPAFRYFGGLTEIRFLPLCFFLILVQCKSRKLLLEWKN